MKHKDIISNMTLREKADFLTGKDFWQTRDFPALGIPSVFLADGPHGLRKQAEAADHLGLNPSVPATCFPTAAAVANSWNPALGERLGRAIGLEAAAHGVGVLLGPGLNLKRNPLCGRNFEYFSEDPYLAGKLAAGYARGIQSAGVAACVKHFACNSQETMRMVSDSVVDERTLRELYLTAFELAVKEGGAQAVMSSYNKVNGVYANENKHLLLEILREEWGFDGVVVTDWAGCNERPAGIQAGNELEMPACRYGADDIVAAVGQGELDERALDACVDRLLSLVGRAGKTERKPFDAEAHHALARECAAQSVVLLKNDGILPLGPDKTVAIIGNFAFDPRYQGAGSSIVNPTRLDSAVGVASACGLNVAGTAIGYKRYGGKSARLRKKAVAAARGADVVLFYMGLDEISEVEGLDRPDMTIPANQLETLDALLSTKKPVVVVLSCGSAVETDWANDVSAVVYGSLGGQAGASAVLDAITGKINPSGKLAETFPRRYRDAPSANNYPGGLTAEYREGPFAGYRYYATAGVRPRYPFGYGTSYTTYEYSGLTVTPAGARFTVENTGDRDGAEIAQLYVSKPDSAVIRPALELKGFVRAALKAGEKVEAEIPFDAYTFRVFDRSAGRWAVEQGGYEIKIGASSEDIRLTGSIDVAGEILPPDGLPACYRTGRIENVSDADFEKLLGRKPPDPTPVFYKKKRAVVGYNSEVADLAFAPGWTGRLFAGAIRFAIRFLKAVGKKQQANTLVMGVLHQPMRGLAKFGGMSRRKMDGMIALFNGKFFRGLKMFLGKDKKEKKR